MLDSPVDFKENSRLNSRGFIGWTMRIHQPNSNNLGLKTKSLLLNQVSSESGLGPTGLISVRRFFYDAYSQLHKWEHFDGMKMDMVSFGEELLVCGSRDEQLIGARILLRFADQAMRRIGMSVVVMERLVEMLNWRSSGEDEIRKAAVLASKLAGMKRNGIRVTGITGAIEFIASLLYNENFIRPEQKITHQQTTADRPETNHYNTFNLLGLLILKKLAKDPDNCAKIGKTKNVIPKIIDFTTAIIPKLRQRNPIAGTDPEIQAAKRALQVIKLLAGTTGRTGRTGETLRKEISEIVFTIGNIREILKHGNFEAVAEAWARDYYLLGDG